MTLNDTIRHWTKTKTCDNLQIHSLPPTTRISTPNQHSSSDLSPAINQSGLRKPTDLIHASNAFKRSEIRPSRFGQNPPNLVSKYRDDVTSTSRTNLFHHFGSQYYQANKVTACTHESTVWRKRILVEKDESSGWKWIIIWLENIDHLTENETSDQKTFRRHKSSDWSKSQIHCVSVKRVGFPRFTCIVWIFIYIYIYIYIHIYIYIYKHM